MLQREIIVQIDDIGDIELLRRIKRDCDFDWPIDIKFDDPRVGYARMTCDPWAQPEDLQEFLRWLRNEFSLSLPIIE